LTSLFTQANRSVREISDVIISSVVPPLLPIYERVSQKLFDRPPMIVGPGIRTGMPVRYENPREVGADRIVNAIAAYEMFGGPVRVVATGGLAGLVANESAAIERVEPLLTLEGLRILYEKNRPGRRS